MDCPGATVLDAQRSESPEASRGAKRQARRGLPALPQTLDCITPSMPGRRSQGGARRIRRCRTGGPRRQSPGLVRCRLCQRYRAGRLDHLRVTGGGLPAGLRLHRPLRRGSASSSQRHARVLGRGGARRRVRAQRFEASASALAQAQHLAGIGQGASPAPMGEERARGGACAARGHPLGFDRCLRHPSCGDVFVVRVGWLRLQRSTRPRRRSHSSVQGQTSLRQWRTADHFWASRSSLPCCC